MQIQTEADIGPVPIGRKDGTGAVGQACLSRSLARRPGPLDQSTARPYACVRETRGTGQMSGPFLAVHGQASSLSEPPD